MSPKRDKVATALWTTRQDRLETVRRYGAAHPAHAVHQRAGLRPLRQQREWVRRGSYSGKDIGLPSTVRPCRRLYNRESSISQCDSMSELQGGQ